MKSDDVVREHAGVRAESEVPMVAVRHLWKIFGGNPSTIPAALEKGASATKAEIEAETGGIAAVRDVSFEVAQGELFVVMGLSGSGKSTLVRCLDRLIEPTAGSIEVDGEDIVQYDNRHLREFRRRRMSMVFQQFGLFPDRRVIDNAAYGLEVRGVDRGERLDKARAVLETVGLKGWEDNYPGELSGGMQQRVGIARALVVEPDILLMDEPFSGLDPLIRREMQDELLRLQDQLKKTIIFITHDLEEGRKLGNRIAIMRDGVLVQLGTPEEVIARPVDDYVKEFTRDVNRPEVITVGFIMRPVGVSLRVSEDPQSAAKALKETARDVAFLVDDGDRYVGSVTLAAVSGAKNRGVSSLRDLVDTGYPSVPETASVQSSLEQVVAGGELVPVVGGEGCLVGEVERSRVLAIVLKKGLVEPSADTR